MTSNWFLKQAFACLPVAKYFIFVLEIRRREKGRRIWEVTRQDREDEGMRKRYVLCGSRRLIENSWNVCESLRRGEERPGKARGASLTAPRASSLILCLSLGLLSKGDWNASRFRGRVEQSWLRVQRSGRDLAGDPSLREGRGSGSKFLGRLHQPWQRAQGG